MLLVALSLFFTDPAPLDMPRAEAYLVREDGVSRLEDRFNRLDLWMSQALIGRWTDEKDRTFLLSALDTCPPSVSRSDTLTRTEYESRKVPMKRVRANADFPAAFKDAITILAPCAVADKPRSPRQLPRGYKEVYYWQHPTNYSDIVCTFLPEKTNTWFLASWHLAEGDDYPTQMAALKISFCERNSESLSNTETQRHRGEMPGKLCASVTLCLKIPSGSCSVAMPVIRLRPIRTGISRGPRSLQYWTICRPADSLRR